MARKQSEAFVLRSFDVGEQDKIVVLFARDIGIFRGIANGARKFGNRFGSSLEPLSLIKVYYYEREGKDLVTISNCDLIESFFEIQNDLETTYSLSYFVELIEEFYPARSKDDTLFRLLLLEFLFLRLHRRYRVARSDVFGVLVCDWNLEPLGDGARLAQQVERELLVL